jgi:hypothetical protein
MSILLPFNGQNYTIPTPGEIGWGTNLDNYLVALAAGTLQKIGGSFTLSAEVDFGTSFGLKALSLKLSDGTVSLPSLTFSNDTNTGLYRIGSDSIGFSSGGSLRLTIGPSALTSAFDVLPDATASLRDIGASSRVWRDLYVSRGIFNSTASNGLRVYGDAGTHQWDMYLNGANLRFSDNTTGGVVEFDQVVSIPFGTSFDPGLGFTGDIHTGLYRPGAGQWCLTTGGVQNLLGDAAEIDFFPAQTNYLQILQTAVLRPRPTNTWDLGATSYRYKDIYHTGISYGGRVLPSDGTVSLPAYSFEGDPNLGLYRIGSDTLGISLGNSAVWSFEQTQAIYNFSSSNLIVLDLENQNSGVSAGSMLRFKTRNAADTASVLATIGKYRTGSLAIINNETAAANPLILNQDSARFMTGTAALPSISFQSDTNTGIYLAGADNLCFSIGGLTRLEVGPSNISSAFTLLPDATASLRDIGSGTRFWNDLFITRSIINAGTGLSFRLYAGGSHQWDIYTNGTNLRFDDNTGAGDAIFGRNLVSRNSSSSTPSVMLIDNGDSLQYSSHYIRNDTAKELVLTTFGSTISGTINGYAKNNCSEIKPSSNLFVSLASSTFLSVGFNNVEKFKIDSAGAISIGNTVNAVSPTSPNRTVTIVIGGVTYYLAAKTTND